MLKEVVCAWWILDERLLFLYSTPLSEYILPLYYLFKHNTFVKR